MEVFSEPERKFTPEIKKKTVALVTEQDYTVAKAAASLGISDKNLHTRVTLARNQSDSMLSDNERSELKCLRKENKELRPEKAILKSESLLRETYIVRYRFIRDNTTDFSVRLLCRMMLVSASAWYAWSKKPVKPYPDDLGVRGRLKALFAASRESAGSWTLVKKLREEGIIISRWRVRKLMHEYRQRRAYKATTTPRKEADIAPNRLNQNFNPPGL